MIVQCDQCNARFRLDDSKVSDQGTKVRCAKCKHIFVARKESPADEADYDSFLNGLVPAPETAGKQASPTLPAGVVPAAAAAAAASEGELSSTVAISPPDTDPDFGALDFSTGGGDGATDVSNTPAGGSDFGELDLAVAKPASQASPVKTDAGDSFDFGEVDFQSEAAPEPPPEQERDFGFGEVNFDSPPPPVSAPTTKEDFDLGEFEVGSEASSVMPAETEAAGDFDFEGHGEAAASAPQDGPAFGEFSFEPEEPEAAQEPAGSGPKLEFDFGEFDFGSSQGAQDHEPAQGGPEPSPDENPFSFDEGPVPTPPAVQPAASPAQSSGEFSFGEEESFAPAGGTAGDVTHHDIGDFSFDIPEPAAKDDAAAKPVDFSFDERDEKEPPFDFGDFNLDDRQPAGGPGQDGVEGFDEPGLDLPIYADEPPPLSIASRRRGSSSISVAMIGLVVLLLLAVAGGGYLVSTEGAAGLNRVGLGFLADKLGMEKKEEGNIAVRNAAAQFLRNREAGEIFVVKGEAVNKFTDPRAAIQVKATLFGPKGEVLLQKSIYCGNSLTQEQVMSMSVADLEKAMANPFGDSLSNLAVQPGKGIPFAVVFNNVPKEASDFGIEVVGSTVAAK